MQLRELREQYNRLQEDYKGKLTEVAGLRTDTDKLKNIAKECEEYKKISEDKIKELEKELKGFKNEKSKVRAERSNEGKGFSLNFCFSVHGIEGAVGGTRTATGGG